MACNDNPCNECNECQDSNPCYDNCGCLNPTTWECITKPGEDLFLGITTGMNGLQVLARIAKAIREATPKKMSTAERDAIVNPSPGTIIYDTTVNKLSVRDGSSWKYLKFE